MTGNRTIFTIGHSNHAWPVFLELLRRHAIERVLDTRSVPRSGYCPHFDSLPLSRALRDEGIDYRFVGGSVGGRPAEPELYDEQGHVLYDRVARLPRFLQTIGELERDAVERRCALLCGEENPQNCHRRLLITPVLLERGVEVLHIRGNGWVESESALREAQRLADPDARQGLLFDFAEEKPWRSSQSVSRGDRPPISSNP